MYLSILTMKLVLPFLLCQRVNSLGRLIFHNQSVSNNLVDDDLLENFLVELVKPSLGKSEFRQITVIAREPSNLLQVQPLLEIHPYVICEQMKQLSDSLELVHKSFVIIFLGDLSKETIEPEIGELSMYKESKFLFISDGIIHFDDIWMIFTLAMEGGLTYVKLAHVVGNAVRLYTNDLAANCSMGVQVTTVWRPGDSLPNVGIDGWTYHVRNLNGCSLRVSTVKSKPDMIIDKNEDGSSSIVGGREGLLILTLAEKLNFTISVINPARRHGPKLARRLDSIEAVKINEADIAIGNIPQLGIDTSKTNISFSFPYIKECMTWGVPRRIIRPNDIVWVEFRWQVWILVGLTFVISCVIRYAYLRMISVKKGKETRDGFVTILLDAIAIHLGIPVVYVSSSASGRFMLLAYLYYSIVITTAYKSSLAATLAGNKGTSAILDVQGIFKANITVRASLPDYFVYRYPSVAESNFLLPREQLSTISVDTANSDLFPNCDNCATLDSRTSLNYQRQIMVKSGQSIKFDILDGCAMNYHFVLYMKRDLELENSINEIIRHLTDTGILGHWGIENLDVDKILRQQMLEEFYKNRATDKFGDIFIFYSGCIAFCLLTFFTELLTAKYP